jgi:hypothetical protein
MSLFRSRQLYGGDQKHRLEPESDRETTVDSEDEFMRVLTPSSTDVESEDGHRYSVDGQRLSVDSLSGLVTCPTRDGTSICGTSCRFRWAPGYSVKQRSLQIWDWDDTLFPSTWINGQGLRLEDEGCASPQQQVLLDRLAKDVEQTLRLALETGDVVIVTNAELGWVDQSCRKFFPSMHHIVETLKVVSARTTYEEIGIFNPLQWKINAFEAEMCDFVPHAAWTTHGVPMANLMSCGDSIHEREALMRASDTLCTEQRRVKSIKLPERPDLNSLHKTHDLLRKNLKNFVEHDGDLDLVALPHLTQIQIYQPY